MGWWMEYTNSQLLGIPSSDLPTYLQPVPQEIEDHVQSLLADEKKLGKLIGPDVTSKVLETAFDKGVWARIKPVKDRMDVCAT